MQLPKGMTVLDFGCGSGRVGRYFPKVTGADVIGVDLHRDAIEWCQAHMPHGTFMVGTVAPPLNLPDNSVDALLAVSVLTHLDGDLEEAWLAEWKRVLKPGGIAVVTYHGEGLVALKLPKGSQMELEVSRQWQERGGIAFIDNKAWAGIFPDAYQTTYHRNDHIRSVWGRHFDILELLPSGGFINQHDVAVLRA